MESKAAESGLLAKLYLMISFFIGEVHNTKVIITVTNNYRIRNIKSKLKVCMET